MSKNKNNIINIPSFQSKNKKAFIGKCKPYKCYNHYYKYTQNTYLTIKFTFKYINSFYSMYSNKKGISVDEKSKKVNYLMKRYNKLNYKSNISFSIITSVVISVFITLMFSILQTPDKNNNTYFSLIKQIDTIDYSSVIQNPITFTFVLTLQFGIITVWLSIFVLLSWLIIFTIKQIYLFYSPMRLILISYERTAIAKAISTYYPDLGKILNN